MVLPSGRATSDLVSVDSDSAEPNPNIHAVTDGHPDQHELELESGYAGSAERRAAKRQRL